MKVYIKGQSYDVDLFSVPIEDIERYKKIEEKMKKGIGIKKFNKKDAKKYLKSF